MDINFSNIPDICLTIDVEPIDLNSFLTINGELQTGIKNWTGAGISPSGIFNPLEAGIGPHLMVLKYRALNCEYQKNVTITIHPLPVADAGEDKFITCLDSIAEIGGVSNSSNPVAVEYNWTGGQVQNLNSYKTQTAQTGLYTLTAYNPITNCINSDEVLVNQGPEAPQLDASILDISCFGYNDGIILVDTVLPGTPPYLFSLNGSPFLPHSEFQQLGSGTYHLRVRDAFGCTDEVFFSITEPDELTVELVITATENPVPFGDSVLMQAITNYAPEFLSSVQWTPIEQFPTCDETNITNCLSLYVTPTGQTVYTVRVEHVNGCAAEDSGQLIVSKDKGIYIPSAFSPNNNDGINDTFRIYADLKNIKNIRSFLVFDRWGELVHEYYNFLPEDDAHGWNGLLRGKKMQPNVFVYLTEVEFFDGSVEIYKGDVTLTK
jgi:gliding motility-associated-like protein